MEQKRDEKGQFAKGMTPWNKGMKGLRFKGSEKGWFKKGQRPANYRPVGHERICSKDGYIIVKVKDDGRYQDRWRHKHVVEWEKAHGKIPDNHVVAFLDSDKANVSLDNLILLSRAELSQMNKAGLFSTDPNVTMAGINLVRLNLKLRVAELKNNDEEKFEEYIKQAERNGIDKNTFIARLKRGWYLEDALNKPLFSTVTRRRQ